MCIRVNLLEPIHRTVVDRGLLRRDAVVDREPVVGLDRQRLGGSVQEFAARRPVAAVVRTGATDLTSCELGTEFAVHRIEGLVLHVDEHDVPDWRGGRAHGLGALRPDREADRQRERYGEGQELPRPAS